MSAAPSLITIWRKGDSLFSSIDSERGVTPEMLKPMSWLGRGALSANQLDKAEGYAEQTRQLAQQELKKHPLDSEPHLPLALGAAIEVESQAMSQRGERAQALAYLRKELALYRTTSIHTRIQKTSICSPRRQGRPALDERELPRAQTSHSPQLRGKPVCCSSGPTGAATASRSGAMLPKSGASMPPGAGDDGAHTALWLYRWRTGSEPPG